MRYMVGVDGCRAGWIAAAIRGLDEGDPEELRVVASFSELLHAYPDALFAVDMPIGLPERIEGSGRGPEQAVRPLLGERQSSVFSIPSRSAVYARNYAAACAEAQRTSTPPRKVSRQAFHLFAKIREVDHHLRTRPDSRVFEVHPEVAFMVLAGGSPMKLPKKIKGRINPPGMEERRRLLVRQGFSPGYLEQPPPPGAGMDDVLDACAALCIARRRAQGAARPFPNEIKQDRYGLPMAIWA